MRHRPSFCQKLLLGIGGLIFLSMTCAGLIVFVATEQGRRMTSSVPAEGAGAGEPSLIVFIGLGLVPFGLAMGASVLLLHRTVFRPVGELRATAARLTQGEEGLTFSDNDPCDLRELADAFTKTLATLEGKVAELQARTEELKASREQLMRTDRLASLGRLAAGLAHEVGNPLGAMLGYVEILKQSASSEDPAFSQDILERLRKEIERIHRIMQDLLAFARPATEAVEQIDVREVIEDTVGLVRPQPRFRQVSLITEIEDGLPRVVASPSRLTQVLVNLLLNAADAVEGHGKVWVRARVSGPHVLVEIEDTGPGVPKEDRERIFDPFFTTKAPGQGTGLGLSTSLSLCESFGATLSLRDTPPGKGAVFEIRLQMADRQDAEQRATMS